MLLRRHHKARADRYRKASVDEAVPFVPYAKRTRGELSAECGARGLPRSGSKAELVARLEADDIANDPEALAELEAQQQAAEAYAALVAQGYEQHGEFLATVAEDERDEVAAYLADGLYRFNDDGVLSAYDTEGVEIMPAKITYVEPAAEGDAA